MTVKVSCQASLCKQTGGKQFLSQMMPKIFPLDFMAGH
jgi:hypothetical protein